jgi:hypothetical protein
VEEESEPWDFEKFVESYYRTWVGLLNRLPADFWPMTPREVADMIRGARWRERREWERAAWTVYYIMAGPRMPRIPTINSLLSFLGPDDDAPAEVKQKGAGPADESPEAIRAFIDGLARESKKHAWTALDDKYALPDEGTGEK